ncbi:MAG: nucleotidyltransferase family protein [Candidatus Omnitrophota bacterium]
MRNNKFENIEGELILLAIKQSFSNDKTKGIECLINSGRINWQRFQEFIVYHELILPAYLVLKDYTYVIPPNLIKLLKNNYYFILTRCQKIWHEFLRVLDVFTQAGITLLPLKGVAFIEDIYSDFPIRPMADIDVLVQERYLRKAEMILNDLGYSKELSNLKEDYWRKEQCHIAFYNKERKNLPLLELHWSLDFKRQNREILPEIWERIREIDTGGRKINMLSPEDTLFSLALHNRRFGKPLCLKNVYDSVLLINKYHSCFDWDYCLNKSRQYGICSALLFILLQSKFLGLNLPEYVEKELSINSWKKQIIDKFIKKSTFSPNQNKKIRNLYLKSHFLLYDTFFEPIKYIINIPQEQFAKFYGLKTYDKKTNFLYKFCLIYIFLTSSLYIIKKLYTQSYKIISKILRMFEYGQVSRKPS